MSFPLFVFFKGQALWFTESDQSDANRGDFRQMPSPPLYAPHLRDDETMWIVAERRVD